jgi:hypothetical protein
MVGAVTAATAAAATAKVAGRRSTRAVSAHARTSSPWAIVGVRSHPQDGAVGGDAHLQRLRAQRQKLIEADEANSFAQLQMIEEKQAFLRAEQQQEQMVMKPAPDQARKFYFDPLGFARRHAFPVVSALIAPTFLTPSSANALDRAVPYLIQQDPKEVEELVFLTVVALVWCSGESSVWLPQVWPGGERIQKPFRYEFQSHLHDLQKDNLMTIVDGQCYPVDMECEYCERSEEFSSYYGEEIWLCMNE